MNMIRQFLAEQRARKSAEKIEKLRKQIAEADAEHTYYARMHGFYSTELETINPHDEWWRFASVKQKQSDSHTDMMAAIHSGREANAKLEALA